MEVFHKPAYVVAPVTAIAFLFGVLDGLKVAGFNLPEIIQHLPLNAQNLAWLIPSTIVLIIAVLIDKVKK